jgi:hypothetical protein
VDFEKQQSGFFACGAAVHAREQIVDRFRVQRRGFNSRPFVEEQTRRRGAGVEGIDIDGPVDIRAVVGEERAAAE